MATKIEMVTLAGDGIGVEVMAEARRMLDALVEVFGFDLRIEDIPCGGRYYLESGRRRDWPEGSAQRCADADVILLGAVGWPDPEARGPVTMSDGRMAGYSPVIGNRSRLDLYANVRPVALYPGIQHKIHDRLSQVWLPEKVDMVFVRENTEGLYAGIGGALERGGQRPVAIDNRVTTREATDRVLRFAFELCRRRGRGAPADGKQRVTAIVKDNVMAGCRLFRDAFFELGADYPEIELEKNIVDAFTQWLIKSPERYDVLVTSNLFGDIVTDLASVLQGGMGLAVGCNLGDEHGMFEPIHGSGPDIAGKDQANPMAMVLALKESLDWLGARRGDPELTRAAELIERAVRAQVLAGEVLTADILGAERASSCRVVGEELARRVKELAS